MSLDVLWAAPDEVELIARLAGVLSVLLAMEERAEERRAVDIYRVARDAMVNECASANKRASTKRTVK